VAAARKAGETDERLVAVAAWRETPYITDAERAALTLAEAATRLADRGDAVPDEIWDAAADHYDERQIAAIILMIATATPRLSSPPTSFLKTRVLRALPHLNVAR
jgi:alkylhydroperoxidase family enzyme